MKISQKDFKQCDICRDKEATSFCPQCFSYYCDACFKPVHEGTKNQNHIKEKIDLLIPIDTHCLDHEKNPINLFCIDDKGNNIIIYNFKFI